MDGANRNLEDKDCVKEPLTEEKNSETKRHQEDGERINIDKNKEVEINEKKHHAKRVSGKVDDINQSDISITNKDEKVKLDDNELKESGLTSDDRNRILTIEGIRDFLSFTFLSRSISGDYDVSKFYSFQDIGISLPSIINKINEPEITIDHSALDDWVLATPRLRSLEWMATNQYEDYLDGIVNGCRNVLLEFHRIFQDFKVYTRREYQYFDPTDVGLKLTSSSLDNDIMYRVFQKYFEILFERKGLSTAKTYEIRIFLNPMLHGFHGKTQDYFNTQNYSM